MKIKTLQLDDSHEYFMRVALQQALMAKEANEIPIGAVVVSQGKIIGKGHNMTEQLRDATAHAEMIALTAAFGYLGGKYLPECELYVTVEPCLMCAGALQWSKIGTVVYGASDEKNGYKKYFSSDPRATNIIHPFHPKTKLISGILAEEGAQLMTNFFKPKR